jgi:hypothetical protein
MQSLLKVPPDQDVVPTGGTPLPPPRTRPAATPIGELTPAVWQAITRCVEVLREALQGHIAGVGWEVWRSDDGVHIVIPGSRDQNQKR